jgi:hypothetical protein
VGVHTDKATLVHLGFEGGVEDTSCRNHLVRVLAAMFTLVIPTVLARGPIVHCQASIDGEGAVVVEVTLNLRPTGSTLGEGNGSH